MKLRSYQEAAVSETLSELDAGENPCLMLPTGAGKSVVLAELCRLLVERGQRVLMLTHVKELIEQNAKRLQDHWRASYGSYAPMGVYSAGLGQKEWGRQITYAGVQSIASRAGNLTADVVIVDEAHLIPTKGEGRYRQVFAALPSAKRIGLTATPWRLGHGSLTEGDGVMFSKLVVPSGSTVRDLVDAGHLSPLRSKHTDTRLLELVGDVHKRGGDFIDSELAAAVNKTEPNELIAAEICARGQSQKHWLVFCVSVDHAREMARILTGLGAPCGVVHGGMSSLERTDTLTRFRVGEYRAVCNVNVLTTGYDFPDLDLLAFCRPTLSPVLYVQMAGRGMRLKSHTDHCLVLDFAGLVATHGPITDVSPPKPKGVKAGECPIKTCPECSELVLISCTLCPTCGYQFPAAEEHKRPALHNDDIMGEVGVGIVASWTWREHVSATSGKKSLAVDYRFAGGALVEYTDGVGRKRVDKATEYLAIWHPDPAGKFAREKLERIVKGSGGTMHRSASMLIEEMNRRPPPQSVKLSMENGYVRVGRKKWAESEAAA